MGMMGNNGNNGNDGEQWEEMENNGNVGKGWDGIDGRGGEHWWHQSTRNWQWEFPMDLFPRHRKGLEFHWGMRGRAGPRQLLQREWIPAGNTGITQRERIPAGKNLG